MRSYTVSHYVLRLGMKLIVQQPLFSCSIHNRSRHRVRKVFFKACCLPEKFILCLITKRNNGMNLGTCLRQGARLIKYNGVSFRNRLQKFSALYSYTVICRLFYGRQHGDWHRHFQSTRIVYHQHRYCLCDITANKPRQGRRCKGVRYQLIGKPLCFTLK